MIIAKARLGEAEGAAAFVQPNMQVEVARLQEFDKSSGKVARLIIACKLYICMKMRGVSVEKQIQWVLSYIQGGLVDIWKENVLEDLERGLLEYETIGEFLADIKKEFGGGNKELVKVTELQRLEQGSKMMEEFVQEFRRAAKGSGYEGCPLIEEFKQGLNRAIRRKLMEAEHQLETAEQWYNRTTILDRNWRESKREKDRLRRRKEQGGTIPKPQK